MVALRLQGLEGISDSECALRKARFQQRDIFGSLVSQSANLVEDSSLKMNSRVWPFLVVFFLTASRLAPRRSGPRTVRSFSLSTRSKSDQPPRIRSREFRH